MHHLLTAVRNRAGARHDPDLGGVGVGSPDVDGEHRTGDLSTSVRREDDSMTKKKVKEEPALSPGDHVRVGRRNGTDTGKAGVVVSVEKTNALVRLGDGRTVRFILRQLDRIG
jgi:hypothetical protein